MISHEQHWMAYARQATFAAFREQARRVWVAADGSSMRPLIRPGEFLLVDFGALPTGLGQIVLFMLGQRVIAHRIIGIDQATQQFIIKGDAEPYYDAPITGADVVGVVRARRSTAYSPAISYGFAGRPARIIARISRWLGRCLIFAQRTTILFPDPLRRIAVRVIASLAWVAAQVLLAPFRWVAYTEILSNDEERG